MKIKKECFLHENILKPDSLLVYGCSMEYEGSEYRLLASATIEFEFDEKQTNNALLSAIAKEEQRLRAEFQNNLSLLKSRRDSLLALSAPEVSPGVQLMDEDTATKENIELEVAYATESYAGATLDWPKFYFTYGCGTDRAGKHSVIYARDYDSARSLMHTLAGSSWAFCYKDGDLSCPEFDDENRISCGPQTYNDFF